MSAISTRRRDFLDVRDVADAYLSLALSPSSFEPGLVLNLASGAGRRIGDILDELFPSRTSRSAWKPTRPLARERNSLCQCGREPDPRHPRLGAPNPLVENTRRCAGVLARRRVARNRNSVQGPSAAGLRCPRREIANFGAAV